MYVENKTIPLETAGEGVSRKILAYAPNLMTVELQFKKGVSPELIQKVYEELEPSDEKCMIRRHLEKKHYRPSESDEKQKQKLIASLARKGFRIGDILSVMREWPEEEQNFQ